MNQTLLAVALGKDPDGRHAAAAGAGAVARRAVIHMARVQANGTVVAMPPTAGHRPHQRVAVAAAKRFFVVGSLAPHGGPSPRRHLLVVIEAAWRAFNGRAAPALAPTTRLRRAAGGGES